MHSQVKSQHLINYIYIYIYIPKKNLHQLQKLLNVKVVSQMNSLTHIIVSPDRINLELTQMILYFFVKNLSLVSSYIFI